MSYSTRNNGEDKFTHVDANMNPTMVNILGKQATKRSAHAQALVQFPQSVLRTLAGSKNDDTEKKEKSEIYSAKGPVFATAIVAGTMAVKKTSDLIPFCHPLPIENCKFDIQVQSDTDVIVNCFVDVVHKTGVEMEALVGASVAALTIYDMCKALSHDIVLKETKLIKKTGGKSDYENK